MPFDLNELKHIRKRLGLTQSQLSKMTGLSQSLIAKIETNKIDPTYSRAKKIINCLNSISGKKEISCKEIMSSNIISVKPDEKIHNAIKLMKKHQISQLPVIAEHKSVGIISESILLDAVIEGKTDTKVSNIMADSAPVIPENSSVKIASELLQFYPLVLVSEKGNIIGIITKSDVIQKVFKKSS